MAEHTPVYLNGTILSEVTCLWPHLFQARQFQGKGDFKFDTNILLTPAEQAELKPKIEALAVSGFKNNEYNRTGALEIEGVAPPPAFKWPYTPVLGKPDFPKLAELFPGHFVMSASAFVDRPPEILIPSAANPGTYIPMPEGQRPQLVFDGAKCYAGVDFATYVSGPNVGIRTQLNFIVFYGAGEKVSVGAKVDAAHALAGVQIAMQQPAGMAQAGAQGAGMVVQGVVQQQPAMQQQPVPANTVITPAAETIATVQPAQAYQLADGTPCDVNGNPLTPQVDFT
jgi:hypothetical protein